MAKKKQDKGLTPVEKMEIGVGLTAAAVAAAGAYFLYGSKNAKSNRTKVKSWALKAKADVLERLEDAKEMTESEFEELVNAIAGTYAGVKSASKGEIKDFQKEMMGHWQAIEKFAKPKRKQAKKTVKKAVQAAKKTATNTPKKAAKKVKKAVKKVTRK